MDIPLGLVFCDVLNVSLAMNGQEGIVACITVGGSRNRPALTINFIPKSKVGLAASVSLYINRYFVYRTSLALYIYKSYI